MLILGLNAFHADASAAIVRDGVLVAAAEEERFRRIKHRAGFPSQAIEYCLRDAGATLNDLDHVAVNQNNRANLTGRLKYLVTGRPGFDLLASRLRNRRDRTSIPRLLSQMSGLGVFGGQFHKVEHHRAHLSSAFHVSPFDDAVVVSVDGFGDFASTAWGAGSNTALEIDGKVLFPHSLGLFYQAVTQYLGFPHYGDEYKVMGLAPYGQPVHLNAMGKIVRLRPDGTFELDLKFFRHHRERIVCQWDESTPVIAPLFTAALEDLLGPRRNADAPIEARHRDIACSAQAMYEHALFHLLNVLAKQYGLTDLALAGGCAMNSAANGKVRDRTPFRRLYIPAAAGDAGGAIGAAYSVWHERQGGRSFCMEHAYWGPAFGTDAIESVLTAARAQIEDAGCNVQRTSDEAELCRSVASAIADGKVVGWFQGRMEWGPRALGNRSILADPRRADMKSILNDKIKRRESFRPFAPSVLQEYVSDWFEDDVAVPFMGQVLQVRHHRRPAIPAVTHVDGSSRLQTVSRQANPRFHKLIEAFRVLTGVPMLLNTSFNENEPIVCEPAQALDCFLRTKMDILVMGDVMIVRSGS